MHVLELPVVRGSTMPQPRPWDEPPEDDPEAPPPDQDDGKT